MSPRPLDLPAEHRAILAEFECLYEQWRLACEAAGAAEATFMQAWREHAEGRGPAPDAGLLQRALDLRACASRLHDQAVQLLRSAPL